MKIQKINNSEIRISSSQNTIEEFFEIDKLKPKISNLKNKIKLSDTIGHIFTVYGYRPPYPFTVFENIYRLSPNKDLIYNHKKNKLTVEKKINLKRINEKWDIEKYYNTFIKACYTSNKTVIIFMSSGWDSSCILACLKKYYKNKKIIPLILELRYGLAKPVNQIEIIKAKKICDYYKLKLHKVVIDYTKKSSLEGFHESSKKMLFNITGSNHYALWKQVKKITKNEKISVFCGEYSDGAHNFGFSQNIGAIYPVKGFRQYGDKVRTYFISPEFLTRISKENNLNKDSLVKQFMPGKILKRNNLMKLAKSMIVNMFVNDFRGPYIDNLTYNKEIYKNVKQSIQSVIINNFLPNKINQLYSSIIRLYQYFHWDASTVKSLYLHKSKNTDLVLPFSNKNLLNLLETMPTNYGRGLEVEPSKYPLKSFCKFKVDYPLHLQEGNHSYIYDIDQSIDLNCILFNKTLIGKLIRKKWLEDKFGIRKKYLNKKIFNMCKKAVINKKTNDGIVVRIIKASAMLDIFLEHNNYND